MNDTTPSIGCLNGGTRHTHHSVIESKVCWGVLPPTALTRDFVPGSGPSSLSPYLPAEPPVTPKQLRYIGILGGDAAREAATHLSKKDASDLITELKSKRRGGGSMPEPAPEPKDFRREMIAGLIDMVPDGYYAVQDHEGGHVDFIRISRPKRNKYAGSIKIQTQHGGFGDGKFNVRAAYWLGSKTLSVYYAPIVDMLLLLVADHHSAAIRYAEKSQRCLRCNAALTDERSRHYHIGPECEKLRPDIIEAIDAKYAEA